MSVRQAISATLTLLTLAAATACGSNSPKPGGVIEPIDAYTAIVRWQASEQGMTENEDGSMDLPSVYVIAAGGGTIDIGIQAAVSEAVADEAKVSFTDLAADAFDLDADGAPVRNNGRLLAIGTVPEGERRVMRVEVDRYARDGVAELLVLRIVPAERDPNVTIDTSAPRAIVTEATPR